MIAYYFNDHLGAPILQTNATGAVVWRVERDPYGERYTTRVGAERHQPLGLPGQEYDASSDRQYNIFRWYRAAWGRYTQTDPIGLRGGVNLYAYVDGNPLSAADPTGLASVAVRKVAETRYRSQDAYLRANPCNVRGKPHFSCTERVLEVIHCPCSCRGDEWGMDIFITIHLRYHLAGPPNTSMPPAAAWSRYRDHEDKHFVDLEEKLGEWAADLENQRFKSEAECNIACGRLIGTGLRQWVNDWAADSNRRLK